MQKMKYYILLVLVFGGMASCKLRTGSGLLINETRPVSQFDRVKIAGGIDAEILNGPHEVQVSADDNVIEHVETDVSGGTLHVRLGGSSFKNADVKVIIQTPGISALSASAGADVIAIDPLINSRSLEIDATSGAEIEAAVDAPEIEVKATSGATVQLRGRTRNMAVSTSSAGEVEAFALKAETVDVKASSASSAEVFASVQLNAAASSASNVRFRGKPETKIRVSSGASVQQD